ncbi:hypothetical protein D3C81_870670 [compost metagenome]
MLAGLDVEALPALAAPAAEHVGVEDAAAATTEAPRIVGELVVGAELVHPARGVVVVGLVVDIVVEGAGAQHRAVVVLAQDQLGQRAEAVGDQAALVEVAIAVVAVEGQRAVDQRLVLILHAHAHAVAGGEGPVEARAVVELDGLASMGGAAGHGHRGGQTEEREALDYQTLATKIVVIVHAAFSPNEGQPAASSFRAAPANVRRQKGLESSPSMSSGRARR